MGLAKIDLDKLSRLAEEADWNDVDLHVAAVEAIGPLVRIAKAARAFIADRNVSTIEELLSALKEVEP